jgi:hypothetical protein
MNVYNNKDINNTPTAYSFNEKMTFSRNNIYDLFWKLTPLDARWGTFNPFAQSSGVFIRMTVGYLNIGEYIPNSYNNLYFCGMEQAPVAYPIIIDRYSYGFSASRKQYTQNGGDIKDILQITFFARNTSGSVTSNTSLNTTSTYYETIELDYNAFVGQNEPNSIKFGLYLYFDKPKKSFTWFIDGVEWKTVKKYGDKTWFNNNLGNFTPDAEFISEGIITFRDEKPLNVIYPSSVDIYNYIVQKNHKLTEKNQKDYLRNYSENIDGEVFTNFSFRESKRIITVFPDSDKYTSNDGFSIIEKIY